MDNSEKQTEDCYYFIQSSCKKDRDCTYRHSNDAKQSTQLCPEWERTKKCRHDCPLRHNTFPVQKKKGDEYCYFEDKGAGCTKPNCEYKHKNPSKDQWRQHKLSSEKFGAASNSMQDDSFVSSLSGTEKHKHAFTNGGSTSKYEYNPSNGRGDYNNSEYIENHKQNREYRIEDQSVPEYDLIECSSNVPSPQNNGRPWLSESIDLSDSEMKCTIDRTKKELNSTKNYRSKEDLNDDWSNCGLNADEKYFKSIRMQNQSIMDKIQKIENEISEVDSLIHSLRK